MQLGIRTTLHTTFDDAVAKTREALSEQGFGVLTEIDVKATFNTKLGEEAAEAVGDQEWLEGTFIPTVAKRGAAIIEARGASSAASAASATVDHARDWALGTPEGDWVSMSVVSDGSYGVPEGLISSFPVTVSGGEWSIVQGLDVNDFSRSKIDASVAELEEEREAVKGLGLI